jgi:uncharacterized membrane protein YdbT with pleckstrin-like domain
MPASSSGTQSHCLLTETRKELAEKHKQEKAERKRKRKEKEEEEQRKEKQKQKEKQREMSKGDLLIVRMSAWLFLSITHPVC